MRRFIDRNAVANIKTCFDELTVAYGASLTPDNFLSGPNKCDVKVAEQHAPYWMFRLKDIFRGCGLPGPYSTSEAEDAIAAHAMRHGRPILSRDDIGTVWHLHDIDGENLAQVMVTDEGELAGLYYGTDLCVLPDYRGSGIARDLILGQIAAEQKLLVWDLDYCPYSPGGAAAHKSTFLDMVEILKEPTLCASVGSDPSP